MRILEKIKGRWQRRIARIRKEPWKAVRRALVLIYLLYTCIMFFTPIKYYCMIHTVLSSSAIYRKKSDVDVDFSKTAIANMPGIQNWVCERLTPTRDYTFSVNEKALTLNYFSGVYLRLTPGFMGQYHIHITTMNIETRNGETTSSGPMAAYGYRCWYNPFLLSWRFTSP